MLQEGHHPALPPLAMGLLGVLISFDSFPIKRKDELPIVLCNVIVAVLSLKGFDTTPFLPGDSVLHHNLGVSIRIGGLRIPQFSLNCFYGEGFFLVYISIKISFPELFQVSLNLRICKYFLSFCQ